MAGVRLTATVGFRRRRPAEVLNSGTKDGSGMAAILEDASVLICVALQYGISAATLAKGHRPAPGTPRAPISITPIGARPAASVIGAALDLITEYEGDAA